MLIKNGFLFLHRITLKKTTEQDSATEEGNSRLKFCS